MAAMVAQGRDESDRGSRGDVVPEILQRFAGFDQGDFQIPQMRLPAATVGGLAQRLAQLHQRAQFSQEGTGEAEFTHARGDLRG